MSADPSAYRRLAERAWAWVLSQVRHDDAGPWLPSRPGQAEPTEDRFGMHSGIGGLAYVVDEIGLARPLAPAELVLTEDICDTLVRRIPEEKAADYFDGLTSTLGVLIALRSPAAALAVARLRDLATADGWAAPWLGPPRTTPDARCNDATLGTAGVLLGAVWAHRCGVPGAAELATHAADVLLAEREERETGTYWPFVPLRFLRTGEDVQMPNWSHGQAGIAAAVAAAGIVLERPDLLEAAAAGAEHLLTSADRSDGGLRLPHRVPGLPDLDTFTYSWCHGPAGTSLLFAVLERAGIEAVRGATPAALEQACLHSLQVSGIPERRYPGFWDNDGRCCGTAGVGDIVLNAWQRRGREQDLAFALTLGDALVERALDGDEHPVEHACWRFVEHRNEDPLLPPGPGWMQGAAGIAAYLFRLARVLEHGRGAPVAPRMDTWWAAPG